MLTHQEKERIKDEETFRDQVRRELDSRLQRPSKTQRLWVLLNTSFALWFLSTVVVGVATWAYSTRQETSKSVMRDQETLQKLDTEIAGRLQTCIYFIEGAKLKLEARTDYMNRPMLFLNVVGCLDNDQSGGTYEQFTRRKFPTLILEAQRLVPTSGRPTLRAALDAYYELRKAAQAGSRSGASGQIGPDMSPEHLEEGAKALEEARHIVNDKIWLARWRP
jgi:hypothetical protein